MAIVFQDTFTGPNGTKLSAHTPDVDNSGTGWAASNGDAEIDNNKCVYATPWLGGPGLVNTFDGGSANGRLNVTLENNIITGTFGCIFRYSDNDTMWGVFVKNDTSDTIRLFRRQGGAWTQPDSWSDPTPQATYAISVVLNGNSIIVEVDGTQRLTTTDSLNATATRHGTRFGQDHVGEIDNIVFDVPTGGTISLQDVADNSVIQRDATNQGIIPVSGTYTESPADIQGRVVADGTQTEIVPWTTIDASPTGGSFSGAIPNVPAGNWYNVQVRSRDSGQTVIDTDNGTNKTGVGLVFGCIGQSNIARWFSDGTALTPGAGVVKYTAAGWSTTIGGDGGIAFGNLVKTATTYPCAMLAYAVGGSALRQEADSGNGYWLNNAAGQLKDNFIQGVNTATNGANRLEAILWIQGERDAQASITRFQYSGVNAAERGLEDLIGEFRAVISAKDGGNRVPFMIGTLGRFTSTGDAAWQAIRLAHLDNKAGDATAHVLSYFDLPMKDSVHVSDLGYQTLGQRAATLMLGLSGESTGPPKAPDAVKFNANTAKDAIAVVFDQDLDSGQTTYDAVAWRVSENGTPSTITSVTRVDTRAVVIALSAPLGNLDDVSVEFSYGTGGNSQNAQTQPESTAITLPNGAGTVQLLANAFAVDGEVTQGGSSEFEPFYAHPFTK